MRVTTCYDQAYYAWQRQSGELGAQLDSWKFRPFLNDQMRVLDFGCGGGFMLASLPARERWGVEINPAAALEAATRLDRVVASVSDIPPDQRFDVIVSHHALEHVERPLDSLRELRPKLASGGKAIFIVPAESWYQHSNYDPNDINQHLYTWTPLLFGNLFTHAGYKVETVDILCHRLTPKALPVSRLLSRAVYDLACRATAFLTFYRQLRIVAAPLSV
jgi:SAM-dependent methyltransferase